MSYSSSWTPLLVLKDTTSLTLYDRALDSLPGDGKLECLKPREEVCGVLSSKFVDWNQW